jgi:hypothetical protein
MRVNEDVPMRVKLTFPDGKVDEFDVLEVEVPMPVEMRSGDAFSVVMKNADRNEGWD